MIFQHTLDAVLNGQKTQTSRLIKEGERLVWMDSTDTLLAKGRVKHVVGRTYAVQPARGQKSVARIRITAIEKRDVRDYVLADALREGFTDLYEFWLVWTQMHDKQAHQALTVQVGLGYPMRDGIEGHRRFLKQRPSEYYVAWVYRFEVVTEKERHLTQAYLKEQERVRKEKGLPYFRELELNKLKKQYEADLAKLKEGSDYKTARGIFDWHEGDEPAEASVRRLRDGVPTEKQKGE